MTLKEALDQAREGKRALGHFNISDIAAFRAIVRAAGELKVPILIGTSEGEAEFVDMDVAAAMVKDAREETSQDIFLNADHFRDLDKVKMAAKAGYDSIIYDGAKLSHEENTVKTKEAAIAIREINPSILVEGEIGYIGESSKLLDALPEGAQIDEGALPTVEEVKRYVDETGVDLIAPAVGNIHGKFKGAPNPDLKIDLIRGIRAATDVHIILHGGSGVSDEDFRAAIEAGVSAVHINTEIRIAWKKGMERALSDEEQIAPYKIFPEAEEAVYEVVLKRLKLFSGLV